MNNRIQLLFRQSLFNGAMQHLQMNLIKAVDALRVVLDSPTAHIHLRRLVSLDIIKYAVKVREQLKIAALEKRIAELERKLSDRTAEGE